MTLENGARRDSQVGPVQMLSESDELVDVGRENRALVRFRGNAAEIAI
jgi:hypothetical protein